MPAMIICAPQTLPAGKGEKERAFLLLLAARDPHAGQGSSDKDHRQHDMTILQGDDERFLGQILAQHCLDFGVHKVSHLSATLQYPY